MTSTVLDQVFAKDKVHLSGRRGVFVLIQNERSYREVAEKVTGVSCRQMMSGPYAKMGR